MRRAVRNLIRLIAAALLVFGVLEFIFEFTRERAKQAELNLWHLILGAILLVAGIVLFATSRKLAEKFTEDFEE
jgi:uncharacterized membrane protein HdeD (DUF308 family)